MANLLRPFENDLESFTRRPVVDQQFILKRTFAWLDLLFVPDRSIAAYRTLVDRLTEREILSLEHRIMKFVAAAIVNKEFSRVRKPSASDWFCYALIRGQE